MSDTEKITLDESRQYEAPDYALPSHREKYFAICRDLGVFDQERMIFDSLIEFIQKKNDNPVVSFTEFCNYLQNKSLPGLTLDVNIRTYAVKFVQNLIKARYCRLLDGNEEAPGRILLIEARSEGGAGGTEDGMEHNEKVKEMIEDFYHNINETSKIDIPFPTQQIIEDKAKELYGLKNTDVRPIWTKGTQSIKVDDFTSRFIDETAGQTNIIRIDFDEENHVLLTPQSGKGLFQSVLAKKIAQYVQDNPDIQDRIRVVLKKNQKDIPDIHNIFSDIGTESSFFWILTFKRIMEYLYQHKKTHSIYLHYYEAASLLYQYSMNKREESQREQLAVQKKVAFREELIQAMIADYSEPWSAERIVQWHNHLPKPLLEEKLSHALAVDLLIGSAPPPADQDSIPAVLTINTKEGQYFIHKFRFCQFFLTQNQKESERLRRLYVEKWSNRPEWFNNDTSFDADIQDHLSDLFYVLLYKTIPEIFSHQNTYQKIFPDMVTIKDMKLHETDLADPAKHKLIYTTLSETLFIKKYSLEVKPLHSLLGMDEKTLHKLAKEFAYRNIPFWKRGVIGFFFRWLFDLIENMNVKEEVRNAIQASQTVEDLDLIDQKYKSAGGYPAIRTLLDRKRQEIMAVKRQQTDKEKDDQRKTDAEEKKKREERIAQLKTYFIGASTAEARLAEYAKEWNTKIGPARQETENNVLNSIRVIMQRTKRFKLTKEEIETLADRVTADPAFAEIKNKDVFKKYVALVVFSRIIKRPE